MKRLTRILALLLCLTMLCSTAMASGYSDMIDTIFNSYQRSDNNADNVYHQIVNGFYRSFEFGYVIALELNKTGRYSNTISSIFDSYERGDDRAETVYQQIDNGTYRTTELLYFIATYYSNR